MRIKQINSHLLSEQHWIVIVFVSLLTVVLTDEPVVKAFLGDKATIRFNVTGSTTITQIELNRCTDQKIFVFNLEHGLHMQDQNYDGRVSVHPTQVILERLQESDFGTYCYKLKTFPNGSLEGKIKLVRETKNVVLTDESVVKAFLGDKATIRFNVTGSITTTQIELNRCTDQKIFEFNPEHGLHMQDQNYDGRVSFHPTHVILERLQESDFGTYCYKLTTFPYGSLEGKIKLVRQTKNDSTIFSGCIKVMNSRNDNLLIGH